MNHLGIEVSVKNVPELDPGFIPLAQFNRAFLAGADKPLDVAVERSNGQVAVWHVKVHSDPAFAAADEYYVERVIKTMLWMYGGFRVYLAGSQELADRMNVHYSATGRQSFDWDYMANVYEHPFEIIACDKVPQESGDPKAIGRHLDGCRIGFDAGGSDRKVSAVIDGEPVFSEEVVWFPKITADPDYHYDGIVAALKSAAEHMPRVDAVGVSSAGVYIDNRTMNASLFLQVPKDLFDAKVKDIYIRAITDTFGDVPYIVANDGDVSALAGAMNLGENNVLGIAMGTSEAVGYVDAEWSNDIGCGVKYFSQDGVIKLAPRAGIELDEALSPAEKLKVVQKLLDEGSPAAEKVYQSIGVYLGHSLALYHGYYGFKYAQLQGRVMSGRGGDIILDTAKAVLADEYPQVAQAIDASLPDEKARRVGQSVAAASLPELRK